MYHRPDLSTRVMDPELMDDPALDTTSHTAALRALQRLNFVSASAEILWRPITQMISNEGPVRLRILDIATGAGDVPISLWRKARRRRIPLYIAGCDQSVTALEHAKRNAQRCGADIDFFQFDARSGTIGTNYDVVMCSLFLHHLVDNEALSLLAKMASAARRLVLVSDLERSAIGLSLAFGVSRILTRSSVVHTDAVRSVRAAFTRNEVRQMAEHEGLSGATVRWRWPWRYLLQWSRR